MNKKHELTSTWHLRDKLQETYCLVQAPFFLLVHGARRQVAGTVSTGTPASVAARSTLKKPPLVSEPAPLQQRSRVGRWATRRLVQGQPGA